LRSSAVALPTVTFLAAGLLAGCSGGGLLGQQRRVCVDPRQNVIDQRQCTQPGGIGRYYYYNGSRSAILGSHIGGGSFTSGSHSSSGSSSSRSSSRVGRGGFGGHSSGG
jgi:hypothetical protein